MIDDQVLPFTNSQNITKIISNVRAGQMTAASPLSGGEESPGSTGQDAG